MDILVVDDIEANRYLLQTLLKSKGHTVVLAENGKQALELARAKLPDLIVSDILMPVMDGFALCHEWKSDTSLHNIPFVFYTATYTEEKDRSFALELGADRFLVKPMENHEFLREIMDVVAHQGTTGFEPRNIEIESSAQYYKEYNERLVHKLEDKLTQLEEKNRQLASQNRALRETDTQIKLLMDSTAEAIVGIDLQGNCTFANQSCASMLGIKDISTILGQSFHRLVHHSHEDGSPYPEQHCPVLVSLKSRSDIHVDDEVFWRPDGSFFDAEYWCHPVYEHGAHRGAVVMFLDITARRAIERELQVQHKVLEQLVDRRTRELEEARDIALQASLAKSMFLANMSHELRTPLNSIIGFTSILMNGRAGPVNDEQVAQLGRMLESGRHLLSMINDILDISKIEAGKVELDIKQFDVVELLADIVESHRDQVEHKDLTIELDAPGEPVMIYSDRDKLWHVVVNLVVNANKFTVEGGLTVRLEREPEHIRISVIDTGVGIPVERTKDIFSSFEQVDGRSTRLYGGVGLGLAICREYTHVLGGEITVDSKQGHGSCFCVRLPRHYISTVNLSE